MKTLTFILIILSFLVIASCNFLKPEINEFINLKPKNISTIIGDKILFSWEGGTCYDDTVIYDLLVGTSESSLTKIATNLTSTEKNVDLETNKQYFWKIIAKNDYSSLESAILNFFLCDGIIMEIQPTNASTEIETDVQLNWRTDKPENAELKYDVYFGDNESPPLVSSEQANNSYDPGTLSKGTTYYWKILAKDGRGGEAYSSIYKFTTVTDPENNPPTKPGTPTPDDGTVDLPIDTTLAWECSDPDGDALKYDVYFGDNESPPLVSSEQANNSYDPGTLSKGTTYYWKIVVKDGRGGVTESDKWSFTTVTDPGNTPPDEPVLTNPPDSSTDHPTNVNLQWTCSDPDGDTLSYDLYFGTNSEPNFYTNNIPTNTFDITNLDKGTTYYWKVLAKDGRGGEAYSSIYKFTTVTDPENNPPTKPGTPTPDDGTVDLPIDTTLAWECSDPDGDALKYDVYFGDNESPPLVSSEQANNSYDPGALSKGTTYYWKIVAKDGIGGTTESDKWSFTTITNQIPGPYNPFPSDDETNVMWDSVTLSWEINGDYEGLYYDIYFGKDELPGIYRIGHAATKITISNLDRGAIYYWQIIVTDEPYSRENQSNKSKNILAQDALKRKEEAAEKGEIWSFTTKENSPPVFVTAYPEDGAIEVSPGASISWAFTDPDGDALSYDVYFENDKNAKIIASNVKENQLSPYMYSLDKYYWKVVAKDGHGGETSSPVLDFETRFIKWQKCFGGTVGDFAYSVQQTSDGGYIVAGYTYSNDGDVSGNHGSYDFWVVKLTYDGTLSWQKCLGGGSDDLAYSIQQTADGGYIVAGYTESNDGDVSGNNGGRDFWVVKLTYDGTLSWQKCLGGTSDEIAYSIQQTADGGYIVAGHTTSNDGDVFGNHGNNDFWVVKLTSDGTLSWQNCLGGTRSEYAYSIQQTADGGYIVAGETLSNDGDVSGNHGSYDFWVVKLTSDGTLSWQNCLGGTSIDVAYSILQTADGGYIVAGHTYSNDKDVSGNHGGRDFWVVKLTSDGSLSWQKCLGGVSDDLAYSIQQTADGGYIVAGHTTSNDGDVFGNHGNNDFWVVKLTSNAILSWQKCLGGGSDDLAYSIQQSTDGGYIVAGYTYSNDGDVSGIHGSTRSDFWVVTSNDINK